MRHFYSPSVNGFFVDDLCPIESMPADSVEISDEIHEALIAGQQSGKRIVAGADGFPSLQDRPATIDQHLSKRAKLLQACDWTQLPDVPMSEQDRQAWSTYRQQLRDITAQPGYPDAIDWPIQPTTTTSETE